MKSIILLFIFIVSVSSYGQNLIKSRQTSYYTYLFKLTDNEAKKIYKNNIWKVDKTFFHTLVDSFPTDSVYKNRLPQGHYLKTFADKNSQKFSITTVQDFDVFIFNNNTDLCVQVLDLNGNVIDSADIRVRWKKLKFDKNTQSYLDRKSNQKGLLKVTYKGFTAYYNLSRQLNNSCIKRGYRNIAFESPVKYVWIPVEFIISLPFDFLKSMFKMRSQGSIYQIKRFCSKAFKNINCLFSDYNCNYCKM